MKYQIEILTNKIVGTFENYQDVEPWEIDENIFKILSGENDYLTLNDSLEWTTDKNKINNELLAIDKEFGNRYIRDFALNNPTAVHNIAYNKIKTAEEQASTLRGLLNK